jgi:hypothetical protein
MVGESTMTLFEYLAAGYTLILTFAVIRGLSGIPHVLRLPGRYWVHTTWLFVGLSFCLIAFWAFWSYREVDWTLLRFVGVLEVPALVFVFNSILVPTNPADVTSWREHFYRSRVPLFATGALIMASVTISNYLMLGTFRDALIYGDVLTTCVFLIGLAVRDARVHAFLASGILLAFAVSMITILSRPDVVSVQSQIE